MGFEPDFELEPQLLAGLEQALETVHADLRATGLSGLVRLVVLAGSEPPNAFAEFWGAYGSTSGITPVTGSEPVGALVAVADDLQDAVMDSTSVVWPVCPGHSFGAHPRVYDCQPVWWCNGGGGHVIAIIGRWSK